MKRLIIVGLHAMKRLLLILALCLTAGLARAQSTAQMGVTPFVVSQSGANSSMSLNMQPPANQRAYLCGFSVTGLGATSAGSVNVALGNSQGNLITWTIPIVAGATTANTPFVVTFTPCLANPNPTIGDHIFLNTPAFGSGNTSAFSSVNGYFGP